MMKLIQWRIDGEGGSGHPMQFLEKPGQFVCWRLPGGLASPPTGNPASALVISTQFYLFYCSHDSADSQKFERGRDMAVHRKAPFISVKIR